MFFFSLFVIFFCISSISFLVFSQWSSFLKQFFLVLFLLILIIPLSSALNEELFNYCSGNDKLIINFIGNEQLNSIQGKIIAVGEKPFAAEVIEGKKFKINYFIIGFFISILIFGSLILFILKRKKK